MFRSDPGEEIVDADDRVVLREQAVTEMGANESGGAGYNNVQIVASGHRFTMLVLSVSNRGLPRPRLAANWR